MTGSYNHSLVFLSIVIATCAAYTALGLAARTDATTGWRRRSWLTGGAIAMGVGIWAMHYIAMLAYSLPIAIDYDLPTVTASLLLAVAASWVALRAVSQHRVSSLAFAAASATMGAAILGMHYVGMAAMRMPAVPTWNIAIVILLVLIAVA